MTRSALALALCALGACGRGEPSRTPNSTAPRPSILLVTLDTTRADAIGPEAKGVETPAFNAIAARALRFRQAYAAVPETLPSHTSMLTGIYPGGHGVHENARYVSASTPLVAERLQQAGYRTSAFVSSFALARRFGLARGFDTYDDALPAGGSERSSRATVDAAIADLGAGDAQPRFLWVHLYDPHAPYEPPEPYRTRYTEHPYLGEVAAMDEQLGRLFKAWDEQVPGARAFIVVADHGEGLGDHGERQHGYLLYQSTVHVPLLIGGPGVTAGTTDTPVSTRRVFHTILDWAGLGAEHSLRAAADEPVLAEAMKPFLEYGWQPQVMTVAGRFKAILSARVESYDLQSDPAEQHDLGSGVALPPGARKALEDYPVPSAAAARVPDNLDEDAKRRLAALGYVGATATPVVRKDAPRPVDMAPLFADMETASGLFTAGAYAKAIPLLEKILDRDPHNLDAQLRLATSYSSLGRNDAAVEEGGGDGARLAGRAPVPRASLRTYTGVAACRAAARAGGQGEPGPVDRR
jgi:hypothetical protein